MNEMSHRILLEGQPNSRDPGGYRTTDDRAVKWGEDYLLSNELRRDEIGGQLERIRNAAAERQGVSAEELDMTNVERHRDQLLEPVASSSWPA